jgi:hypothetical protein
LLRLRKALPGRLELPTLRLTASRSNQMSYGSICSSVPEAYHVSFPIFATEKLTSASPVVTTPSPPDRDQNITNPGHINGHINCGLRCRRGPVRYGSAPLRARARARERERARESVRERERARESARERGRAREIAGERERARESARERGRARESAGERGRARESAGERERARESARERERVRESARERKRARESARERERGRARASEGERGRARARERERVRESARSLARSRARALSCALAVALLPPPMVALAGYYAQAPEYRKTAPSRASPRAGQPLPRSGTIGAAVMTAELERARPRRQRHLPPHRCSTCRNTEVRRFRITEHRVHRILWRAVGRMSCRVGK